MRAFQTPAEAAGPFTLEKEIRELKLAESREREALGVFDRSLADLRRARQDAESDLPALREGQSRSGARLSGFLARFEEKRAERDRLARERETLEAEAAALSSEASQLATRREAFELEERRHAGREAEIRARAESLAAALPEARALASAASEELAHRRTEAEVAAERRRSTEAARQKLLEAAGVIERRATDALDESQRLGARRSELLDEERETRARQAANLAAREGSRGQLETAADAAAEASARVSGTEESTRTRRAELDAAREARFEAEVAETRVHSDLDHVVAQAKEEFGVAPGELPAPAVATEEGLAALEAEALELAAAIERLGPVNVLAYEEYAEESKRQEFLTAQRDDLLRSIEDLQDSIRKINATSSERFLEAFTAINQNFSAMFTRLFRGRRRPDAPPGRERSPRVGCRDRRAAAGQAEPVDPSSLGRRKGPDRDRAAHGDLPLQALSLLHPRRGGRAPGRGEHRPVHAAPSGNDRRHPIHRHHPQQTHDGDRGRDVRGDDGRTGLLEDRLRPVRLRAFLPPSDVAFPLTATTPFRKIPVLAARPT